MSHATPHTDSGQNEVGSGGPTRRVITGRGGSNGPALPTASLPTVSGVGTARPGPPLEWEHCSFAYDGRKVLNDVSLSLERGAVHGLAGPNGSGKTTLLRLAAGLLRPASGQVRLEGEDPGHTPPSRRARTLGMVPQETSFQFPYRVVEVVRMGRAAHQGLGGFENRADEEVVQRVMAQCDLHHLGSRYLSQLSGGERQRVVLARALAQQPRILALDEPMRGLDPRHTADFLATLRRIRDEEELTILVVSHALNLLARFTERVALLKEGRLLHAGPSAETLTADAVRDVFGVEVEVLTSRDGHPVLV